MAKYKILRRGIRQKVEGKDKAALIGSTIELSDSAAQYFLSCEPPYIEAADSEGVVLSSPDVLDVPDVPDIEGEDEVAREADLEEAVEEPSEEGSDGEEEKDE